MNYLCLDGSEREFIRGKQGFFSHTWPPVGATFEWIRQSDGEPCLYLRLQLGDVFGNTLAFDPDGIRFTRFTSGYTIVHIDAIFEP